MKYDFDKITDRKNTSCVKWDYADQFLGGKDVLPMWVADMDFETPDFIRDAVIERATHPIYGYTVRPDSYYESIIKWIKDLHGWEIKKDWILFSPGIVPAVNLAVMAYTKPGDKIIVQPPVYFPFFSAVTENGRQLVNNQLLYQDGKYVMDFEDLEKNIDPRTRMIILSNPHNPVGRAWTKEELLKLAGICLKHKIIIVSDEIHSDLVLDPFKHIGLSNLSKEISDITISMMAPSKTFNLAGMGTSSVIISNPELRNAFNTILDQVHVGMGNLFGMVASEAAYSKGKEWRKQMLDYVKANVDYVEDFVIEKLPEIKMIRPQATYMIWLDFSQLKMSSNELKDFISNNAKLGLNDGPTFGLGGEGFQRMNVACPMSMVVEAMERLGKAVQSIRK
jgi:cystathionine beta-lyase